MGSKSTGAGGNSAFLDPLGALGSDSFREASLQSRSVLQGPQQNLLQPLSDWIMGQLQPAGEGSVPLQDRLTADTSDQSKTLANKIFSDALLGPSMREYDQTVAPKIAGDFAGIGGTLSSRRDATLNYGRQNVEQSAQGQLAGLLPQIESFPLQQTLAQIQGLGQLQTQRLQPFQLASAFATTPTQQTATQPQGSGWGILSSFLGIL